MMKKNVFFLLTTLLAISCSKPSNEQIIDLIYAIPDHQFTIDTEKQFTNDYFALLKEAWAIPSDAIGEIGSDEWLYYFVSGNGDEENGTPEIKTITSNSNGTTVVFFYNKLYHTLKLTKEGLGWVISDFDDTKAKLEEYIGNQRKYFQSDDWKEYLKDYDEETQKEAQKEVDDYFRQYPN